MAVLIEGISILVPNATLELKYEGGVDRYRRDAPNDSFCSDGLLTRVGFMTPAEVTEFVNALQARGLQFYLDGRFVDIAIVDQHHGSTSECEWLALARHPSGLAYGYLPGSDPSLLIAVPPNWSSHASLGADPGFVPAQKMAMEMLFLRSEAGCDIYLNRRTGREERVTRTKPIPANRVLN